MTFRKANGEVVEIDSDEPLSVSELRAMLGEADDSGARFEALAKRLEAIEARPATPAAPAPAAPAPPPKPAPHPSWTFEVSKRDREGRIEGMIIRPAEYLR